MSLNINLDIKVKEQEKASSHFIDGRNANIFLDEKKIGEIGEVHPKILKNFKIKMPVALFEIELEPLFEKF